MEDTKIRFFLSSKQEKILFCGIILVYYEFMILRKLCGSTADGIYTINGLASVWYTATRAANFINVRFCIIINLVWNPLFISTDFQKKLLAVCNRCIKSSSLIIIRLIKMFLMECLTKNHWFIKSMALFISCGIFKNIILSGSIENAVDGFWFLMIF